MIDGINGEKEGYSIERATGKSYKYYLHVPDVTNPVKFYTPHIPRDIFADETKLKELNGKLIPACRKSHKAWLEKIKLPPKAEGE